ncbi:MAG: hypothetical protein M1537_07085 [Nitrospirae bacterium]|nr:hypothetical protein [Nitrospirota bacterium]
MGGRRQRPSRPRNRKRRSWLPGYERLEKQTSPFSPLGRAGIRFPQTEREETEPNVRTLPSVGREPGIAKFVVFPDGTTSHLPESMKRAGIRRL